MQENPSDWDRQFAWHPFTNMGLWLESEPLSIVSGQGSILFDQHGNAYLDGNSSIWTNIHGHNHPRLNAAAHAQLSRIAHSSFLGFSNPPAAQLCKELCQLWTPPFARCFLSDNGSTAIEASLKIALQYHQLTGHPERKTFASFSGAYHGDTLGASSLGGISLFFNRFQQHHWPVLNVASLEELDQHDPSTLAAIVIEPLIQGANRMRFWPEGMLRKLHEWCRVNHALLIADEVMTGFGRTGKMFACEHEHVRPDLVALAKGLTGGYSPLAATLVSEQIFEPFQSSDPSATLFYGHSYTGHQLGCALALENLAIFRDEPVLEQANEASALLQRAIQRDLATLTCVANIRIRGLVAAFDLINPVSKLPFPKELCLGAKVCLAARNHGLLTRPILDTLVIMPPLCVSTDEINQITNALKKALLETLKTLETTSC
jgi:adenosylmethionine-8-amino-7-oxononanoate aminotransferase